MAHTSVQFDLAHNNFLDDAYLGCLGQYMRFAKSILHKLPPVCKLALLIRTAKNLLVARA